MSLLSVKNSQKSRGFTLIEVVIASALMLMLLLAFYAVAEALQRSQLTSDARLEARQALRNAMRAFTVEASAAGHFFEGSGGTVTLGGLVCKLPAKPVAPATEHTPGDTVVVAVPLDETRPANITDDPDWQVGAVTLIPFNSSSARPDGFPDNRYNIIALTTRPRTPADSRNANARQIVIMRWDRVQPPGTNYLAPATINLAGLGAPAKTRVYDAYVKPLNQDGFRVTYSTKATSPAASNVHVEYAKQPTQGSLQTETYDFLFNTRNIF